MARTQTMVQLTDRLIEMLDEIAAGRRVSRSALIRDIIDTYLAERSEDTIGKQIADGYRRIPPGAPDRWGSLEAMTGEAARDVQEGLDADESLRDRL